MSKTESAKPDTSVSFRTSIGGQALIEGILMRGPTRQAIVCRTQDGMVEKVEELHWVREKHPILGWPLIRGVIVFLDSMVKGMKALTYSADLLPEDEQEEPGKIDLWIEKHFGEEKAKDIIIGTAVVLGIALSIVLFILIPTLLVLAVLAPVVEELVFRGLLYGWVAGRWGPLPAFIVSSLVFAAAHAEPAHIVLVLPLGFWFGWLRWRTNSLWPTLITHMINNAFAVLGAAYLAGG